MPSAPDFGCSFNPQLKHRPAVLLSRYTVCLVTNKQPVQEALRPCGDPAPYQQMSPIKGLREPGLVVAGAESAAPGPCADMPEVTAAACAPRAEATLCCSGASLLGHRWVSVEVPSTGTLCGFSLSFFAVLRYFDAGLSRTWPHSCWLVTVSFSFSEFLYVLV